jgi:hypothetical protein
VSEIRVPIGISIGSHSSAVPMVTAASVSGRMMAGDDVVDETDQAGGQWPSTNGRAR